MRHKDIAAGLEEDVRWLTDLLPQTFRDHQPSISARIFCYNYQSAWLGPHLSRNRLEGLAVRLLDDIHNARDKVGPLRRMFCYFVLTAVTAEWRCIGSSSHLYWPFLRWARDRASGSPSKLGWR